MILWLIFSCCLYEIGGNWKVWVLAFVLVEGWAAWKEKSK